jgi:hypothetical protein
MMPIRPSVAGRAAVLGLALAAAGMNCGDGGRSGRTEFAAGISASSTSLVAFEAETAKARILLRNLGRTTWDSKKTPPVLLSYHVLDPAHNTLRFENRRFTLPSPVEPGGNAALDIEIKAPLEAGEYLLEFDLLREGAAWFKDGGSKTLDLPLTVKRRDWPEDAFEIGTAPGAYTSFATSVPEFDALRRIIRTTLRHNEVVFAGRSGEVRGFAAGGGYPQIWIRDANTILPASRWYYDEAWLRSWLEEHLAFQDAAGGLQDWIDSRGTADKNTTETDQETSAVQAAAEVVTVLGPDWLRKPVAGVPVLERLDRAMKYVLAERFNPGLGLVKGAHTVDWGDVDLDDADQTAVYVDADTHWTADIYDQAMFFGAANDLAGLSKALGFEARAAFWSKRAAEVRRDADRILWLDDRGYYRVHVHLDALRHDFDEDAMFAMGGNAVAIASGLAGPDKKRRIFEEALRRQAAYKISTVGGAILPPYPKGVFRHPMMDDPFEYQNGGQWDWFGGRLVDRMFRDGRAADARAKLLEIARKAIANNGLYEWDNPDGVGRGSDFYSGSAGVLAGALIGGYFGVSLSKDGLILAPRLRRDNGRIHAHLPAAGRYAAYDYAYGEAADTLTMSYASDFPGRGEVRILNPFGTAGLEATLDGSPAAFRRERIDADEYLVIETDFRPHALVLRAKKSG